MTIGQLGHHIGLHVNVNLEGKRVGGVVFSAEEWVPGVIVGSGALGDSVTIKLDAPVGGGDPSGPFHHASKGEEMVSVDDPQRIRPLDLSETQPAGVPAEILELVRKGKTREAILRYRALNGATLDEAQAFIAGLGQPPP
jgi:hypothetical protein